MDRSSYPQPAVPEQVTRAHSAAIPAGRIGWWLLPLGALLAGLAMAGYIEAILIPGQVADAQVHGTPRGNLSDLYPRWLGARELLWHGRDPYSADLTREIQVGYYGRALTPADTTQDQQGFAYPLYVVFLLAPLTLLPFNAVQPLFGWSLLLVMGGSVGLWLGALRWRVAAPAGLGLALLAAGSWPGLQAWALEQLTALVAALLAGAAYCLARGVRTAERGVQTEAAGINGWYIGAGVLLAAATIKPQLAAPLLLGLAIWGLGNWRARQGVAWGFGGALGLLLAGSFWLLPGWVGEFQTALAAYQQYTNGHSLLWVFNDVAVGWGWPGSVELVTNALAGALVVGTAAIWWQARRVAPGTFVFSRAVAATLVITLLIIPTWAPYNQLLLIPALLLLLQQRAALWDLGRRWVRWAWLVAFALTVWPWLAAGVLLAWLAATWAGGTGCCAAPVYSQGAVLPLLTSLFVPLGVLVALAGLWATPSPNQTNGP